MKPLFKLWFVVLIVFTSTISFAQNSLQLDQKIPTDPSIKIGTLSNGLKYYIKNNKKPEDRAILRLVVNAGSVLEDDDQQGLAHFVEHMGFNGTKNFKKHELIDYLESIGMKFGPEVNAYTSFDETVYMIDVPTDSLEMVKKGVQILGEWAHNVSFDNDEIDKERGVIVEEWRLRRGAWARISDKQYPVIFNDSKYADRLPIGKMDIVKNFKYNTIKRFYKDWYRPDLMAVVAVGDFDASWMENLIKEQFSKIKKPGNERKREVFNVPDNKGTLYTIATDPEATQNVVQVYFKMPVEKETELKDYRKGMVENLFTGMLNARLQELSREADPPFVYAYSGKGRLIRSKALFNVSAVVKDNGIDKGLETLLTEIERVRRYGYTQSELERQKSALLRGMEKAYNEKDKTESSRLASEYIRNYLYQEPIPGISYEYDAYKKFLPGITLKEVNNLSSKWVKKDDRVVAVAAPEKKEVKVPNEKELASIFDEVLNKEIKPYDDKVSNVPLLSNIPKGSKVIDTKKIEGIEVTQFKLANGATVVLKPTDFKNDEIRFRAFSPGGNSLVPNDEYVPAETITDLINENGVGKFDANTLQKMLTGKVVNVAPFVGELSEGINGSASPRDLETMFQLIYLYFTQPRMDSTTFLSYKTKMQSYLQNRSLNPLAAFQDTVMVTLANYHQRRQPWNLNKLDKLNNSESLNIYKDRFADASDFTFVFVGNFDVDKIKPMIETYIGGLPSIERKENWKNLHVDPPKGVIEKTVNKGIDPKSMVNINFTGPYDYSYEHNFVLYAMRNVLDIKLREILREDKGGTYGVYVGTSGQKYPDQEYNIRIQFGCSPDRVDELVKTLFQEIDSLKTYPVSDIYMQKTKETIRRTHEVELKDNGYWLNTLYKSYFYDLDISKLLADETYLDKLTKEDIMQAIKKYLNEKNYIKVVLMPQKS